MSTVQLVVVEAQSSLVLKVRFALCVIMVWLNLQDEAVVHVPAQPG